MSNINSAFTINRNRWLALILATSSFVVLGGVLLLGSACSDLSIDLDFLGVNLSGLMFAVLGLLIVIYRPQNRIGWLCLGVALSVVSVTAATSYAECGLGVGLTLPGVAVAAWYDYMLAPTIIVLTLFLLLPMLFPNGRFLTPLWRRAFFLILTVVVLAQLVIILSANLRQESIMGSTYPLDNPLALLPADWSESAEYAWGLATIAGAFLAIASLVTRFRRSRGIERQQLKWLAYYAAAVMANYLIIYELVQFDLPKLLPGFTESILGQLIQASYGLGVFIIFTGMPLTIGIALLRYRLYDIDIIIRRTLQYSIVSATLALAYFGSVTLMQRGVTAVTGTKSPVAIVASTLLIAALFNPLRHRVQRFLDRRFYRQKYDAEQVLARFARTARDEVELGALTSELVSVVGETMQPQSVGVWLRPWETSERATIDGVTGVAYEHR